MLQGEISKKKTCPPLGNSLKYYRTSFVGTSTANQATDHDKTILAQKAGCLLALAENTLYEMKKTDSYQIFKDKSHDVWTAIYFKEDYRPKYFNGFVHEVEQLQGVKNVYIFSWGDVGSFDSYFEYLSGGKSEEHSSAYPRYLQIFKCLRKYGTDTFSDRSR